MTETSMTTSIFKCKADIFPKSTVTTKSTLLPIPISYIKQLRYINDTVDLFGIKIIRLYNNNSIKALAVKC